jgi:hypothetical protein
MANANAKVQILKVGHAMFLGARGEAGGAPSKDSIVGVALISNSLVTFGGRRHGTLKFYTHPKAQMDNVLAKFQKKLTGNPFGKAIDARYDELTRAAAKKEILGADFAEQLSKGFNAARRHGKLNINTRATAA